MPVSIIFTYTPECREKALAAGFVEKPCLVRQEDKAEQPVVGEIINFNGALQFIAAKPYWGAGPD